MPNRIPTPSIPTPAVRKSSAAQTPANILNKGVEINGPKGVAARAKANLDTMSKLYPGLYNTPKSGPTRISNVGR